MVGWLGNNGWRDMVGWLGSNGRLLAARSILPQTWVLVPLSTSRFPEMYPCLLGYDRLVRCIVTLDSLGYDRLVRYTPDSLGYDRLVRCIVTSDSLGYDRLVRFVVSLPRLAGV